MRLIPTGVTLDLSRGSRAGHGESPPRLSGRQAEILTLLADGLGTPEAAARLRISPDEAREHLRAAMRALGAGNKIHALILALRAGLIEPPPG